MISASPILKISFPSLAAILIAAIQGLAFASEDQSSISLAGTWQVMPDPKNIGISQNWVAPEAPFVQTLHLPGTTDEAGIGVPLTTAPVVSKEGLSRPQRNHSFLGPVWYRRTVTIPEEWKGKRISLFLERVLWESSVWLDGKEIGRQDSLSTPHLYDLTKFASPGKHELLIRVDNRQFVDIGRSHAYIDDTQTIWNGIAGRIELRATPPVWIDSVRLDPDPSHPSGDIRIGNQTREAGSGTLRATLTGPGGEALCRTNIPVSWDTNGALIRLDLASGSPVPTWSEFHPDLCRLELTLETGGRGDDLLVLTTGFRKISHTGPSLLLNDLPVFLRGTHEGCSFPLTGHPPMTVEEWRKIFRIVKSWGLNHMRFHSYTPPEACFTAADQEGVYLQSELPIWTGDLGKKGDDTRTKWVRDEAARILKSYGNHPSLILMSLGNELHGQYNFMQTLLKELQAMDPRRLYTMTSNRLWVADAPEKAGEPGGPAIADDFLVERALVRNGKKESLRGQGFFNEEPNTAVDFSKTLEGTSLPLLTHEIGQWTVFPNLGEIPKYTGVLRPSNLEAIRDDLKKNGMLDQAGDFTRASGRFSAELYKQELELALRSKPLAGYQLLDLHDYPGQGTAHIGLLDSFWDSKGIADPAWFRESAAPVVPLLRMPKRVYSSGETFKADLEFANYSGKQISDVQPVWEMTSRQGLLGAGTLTTVTLPIGAGISTGEVSLSLERVTEPTKATIRVMAPEARATNSWNIWIVPQVTPPESGRVLVTASLKEALAKLKEGGAVLYTPSADSIRQRQETGFLPAFWSPVYFTNQPGTMGLLIQKDHPALAGFPTDQHSDWQWWSILTPSPGAVVLDHVKSGKPIVQVIDSFARNQKLGLIFEAQVGTGHLMVCSADLAGKALGDPMRRQLRSSLVDYLEKPMPRKLTVVTRSDLELLFRDPAIHPNEGTDGKWSKDLEPPPEKK